MNNKPNRLIEETSPYLQQHAYNPVDWHPWGDEALRKSRDQDKPILLSVGYSACHWCHVMERESFEDPETAHLMNRLFINVKVDREERPDIDAIYMNYVQMTTGAGGWPLTVFLTPQQVPFYGGTYFPPVDHYGRPSFRRVLEQTSIAYQGRRSDLDKMAPEIISRLEQAVRFDAAESALTPQILEDSYRELSGRFDSRHGGFGSAPKFPSTMALSFLLRYHSRTGSKGALEMACTSLNEMARGGIFDQIGGGFHRYTVDERWLVPHFEKMLYDNALLARLYLQAFQLTKDPFYQEIVEQVLEYVQREMTDPAGAFYSSQDADSEGEEGRFYVWSKKEIEEALGGAQAKLFCDFYGVTSSGNFEGSNILNQRYSLTDFGRSVRRDPEEMSLDLKRWRNQLFEIRSRRVWPDRDEKALAGWNGMMLTAFAEAAFVLKRSDFCQTAENNARFLVNGLMPDGALLRSWRSGVAKVNAFAEDYATVTEGLLTLFEVTGCSEWLAHANRLMRRQYELFRDPEQGDFFFTASDHETLLVRHKEHMDNATPSGNSTTCLNLLRLSRLLGEDEYQRDAERMLRGKSLAMSKHPLAFGYWLQALDHYLGPVQEIVVVGEAEGRDCLLDPLRQEFLPNRILVQSDGVPGSKFQVSGLDLPLLQHRDMIGGKATLYLCEDNVCRQPMTEMREVEGFLRRSRED